MRVKRILLLRSMFVVLLFRGNTNSIWSATLRACLNNRYQAIFGHFQEVLSCFVTV